MFGVFVVFFMKISFFSVLGLFLTSVLSRFFFAAVFHFWSRKNAAVKEILGRRGP